MVYKLTITSEQKEIPAPELPEFKGFMIITQTQSSRFSVVGSEIKTSAIYTYILSPCQVGRLKIEPGQIKIDGQLHASEGFEIEVSPGENKPEPDPEQEPSLPQDLLDDSEKPRIIL